MRYMASEQSRRFWAKVDQTEGRVVDWPSWIRGPHIYNATFQWRACDACGDERWGSHKPGPFVCEGCRNRIHVETLEKDNERLRERVQHLETRLWRLRETNALRGFGG